MFVCLQTGEHNFLVSDLFNIRVVIVHADGVFLTMDRTRLMRELRGVHTVPSSNKTLTGG